MGANPWEAVSRATNRFSRFHLILLALVLIVFIVSYGGYSYEPDSTFFGTSSKSGSTSDPAEQFDEDPANFATDKPLKSATTGAVSPPEPSPTYNYTINGIEVYPPPPPADEEEYIAICLMVKDAAPELGEFITHHYYHHGIRRFYVYDDGSSPPAREDPELEKEKNKVPDSALSFFYIDPESVSPGEQRNALQDTTATRCVKDHGAKHHWMGLFDVDEYIEMRDKAFPVLKDWLKEWEKYDDVGAVGIQWLPHNSAGLVEIPSTGFRHTYNRCVSVAPVVARGPKNIRPLVETKNFVRPQFIEDIPGIHRTTFHNDTSKRYGELDDEFIQPKRLPATHEYWALHHYATGSKQYFEKKGARGRMQGPGIWEVGQEYWDNYHKDIREYECDEMVKYVP